MNVSHCIGTKTLEEEPQGSVRRVEFNVPVSADSLPDGLFDRAMEQHLVLHEQRVRAMYNRHRAVFAESVVAACLSGAEVTEDPAAAWDVTWAVGDRDLRIQVKCSGEYLPRMGGDHRSPPRWSFEVPKSGFDHTTSRRLPSGLHCDVFVFARHIGREIDCGWSFWAVAPAALTRYRNITPKYLREVGAIECAASDLAEGVASAAR